MLFSARCEGSITLLLVKKTNRWAIALSSLLVYLLLGQIPLSSLVMCFGENGHFALEMPHNASTASTSQHDEALPCLDFPLLMASSDHRQDRTNVSTTLPEPSPQPITITTCAQLELRYCSLSHLRAHPSVLHPSLVYLQTTRLLI
jgi:hypothetical protein